MSTTDKAWTNLVDCFFLKCRGESWLELKDAINAYAAAAVAEARAPLVEALKEAHAGLVAILTIPSASAAYDDAIAAAKDGRAAAVAALAKETPDA